MNDLIERLEKATGSDRKLDAQIECAVMGGSCIIHPDARISDGYVLCGPQAYFAKPYTSSIDAALTLVPPTDWEWLVRNHNGKRDGEGNGKGKSHFANVLTFDPEGPMFSAYASGPAIALCIAALKARLSLPNESKVP